MRLRPIVVLSTALMLSACAAARPSAAPVLEESPVAVPAGVTPLTVEQEQDSAGRPANRLPPDGRIG